MSDPRVMPDSDGPASAGAEWSGAEPAAHRRDAANASPPIRKLTMQTAGQAAGQIAGTLELPCLIDRLHRRYLDVLRSELTRRHITDISASQVMMLVTIGDDEISVRHLIERGYYLGSNSSYNLKHLVAAGYVARTPLPRDRRIVLVRSRHVVVNVFDRGIDPALGFGQPLLLRQRREVLVLARHLMPDLVAPTTRRSAHLVDQ